MRCPSKPPRNHKFITTESSIIEQQTDNLVEEIYLAPESNPLVKEDKKLSSSSSSTSSPQSK